MKLKDKIIKYLDDNGIKRDTYRIKYYKCSRYQQRYKPEYRQEECWLYDKEPIKEEITFRKNGINYRRVDNNGEPILKSQSGLLITAEDFENKDYMLIALDGFKFKIN